jgi:hypothetical protein
MTPLEILFQVLGLVAAFAGGCWTGRSKCHIAFEVSSDEERGKCFPCLPNAPSLKGRRSLSDAELSALHKIP